MSQPPDNRDRLVTVAVAGRVAEARWHNGVPHLNREGKAYFLPGTGGVVPGVHAGDPVGGWVADHLMVGASIEDSSASPTEPGALHLLACLGNRVRDTRGEVLGIVAGKRGGLAPGYYPPNLVSVEIPDRRLEMVVPGDGVVVEAIGRGLALLDHPDVSLSNLSPRMLDALRVEEQRGRLRIPVLAVVASRFAGAGLGQDPLVGDLEIADPETSQSGQGLRFGDVVAFESVDSRTTRFYRPGFVSVGVVCHGPSPAPGHGVGVCILLSGPVSEVNPEQDSAARVGVALRQWAEES